MSKLVRLTWINTESPARKVQFHTFHLFLDLIRFPPTSLMICYVHTGLTVTIVSF